VTALRGGDIVMSCRYEPSLSNGDDVGIVRDLVRRVEYLSFPQEFFSELLTSLTDSADSGR
jgi:hypothetical protein